MKIHVRVIIIINFIKHMNKKNNLSLVYVGISKRPTEKSFKYYFIILITKTKIYYQCDSYLNLWVKRYKTIIMIKFNIIF